MRFFFLKSNDAPLHQSSYLLPYPSLLTQRLLTYEPTARITCREAQEHPYFADLVSQNGTV